jgi:hypothetical protein
MKQLLVCNYWFVLNKDIGRKLKNKKDDNHVIENQLRANMCKYPFPSLRETLGKKMNIFVVANKC